MSLRLPSFAEVLNVARGRGRDSEAPDLWDNLIADWTMIQGGGGKLYDTSGYDNHGTLTNMDPATDWVATKKGWALDPDGVNQYVDCGGPLGAINRTNPWTVFLLLAADVPGSRDVAFSDALQHEYSLEIGVRSNELRASLYDWVGAAYVWSRSTALTDTGWHTAVAVSYGATGDLYLDGVPAVGGNIIGAHNFGSGTRIGHRVTGDHWDGRIALAGVASNAWPAAKVRRWHADPHALHRLRRRVFPAAAAPGFKSAWAQGVNQYIGLGT